MYRFLAGLLCLLWTPLLALAADRVIAADRPIKLRLALNQPCVVAFPETVDDVKVGYDEKALPAVPNGPYLYLISKVEGLNGWLFVTGASGKLYTVDFETASAGTPADKVVHVTATPTAKTSAPVVAFTAESLLRALYTQTTLPGSVPATIPAPLLPESRLVLLDASSVQVGPYLGQVLYVQNSQQEEITIDARPEVALPSHPRLLSLQTWTWPPMLPIALIMADPVSVAPGQTARILIVYKKGS